MCSVEDGCSRGTTERKASLGLAMYDTIKIHGMRPSLLMPASAVPDFGLCSLCQSFHSLTSALSDQLRLISLLMTTFSPDPFDCSRASIMRLLLFPKTAEQDIIIMSSASLSRVLALAVHVVAVLSIGTNLSRFSADVRVRA